VSDAITIKGIDENGRRISSKAFEEMVQKAAEKYDRLILETFGQHNVGGRLKTDGRKIDIEVKGPCGQRLGCMAMPGTTILCHGPASDDVGYLNIGAEITVLGDATNGVCNAMAEGKVFIGGYICARGLTMT
jgi:glutamate synthase domain-containing protein 3